MNHTISSPTVETFETDLVLPVSMPFSLMQTLDCGQAFRWEAHPESGFHGVAGKYFCHFLQIDNTIRFYKPLSHEEWLFWHNYFDLGRDYDFILKTLARDSVLKKAIAFAPGIRILRQDPWEALCSFIISQNNHIPRIKGIIARLCATFGEATSSDFYTFPEPEILAALSPDDLAPLRAGFRARYIIDAAQKVASGIVDLASLSTMPLQEARQSLCKITGVGAKVAECTLLYGCGRVECFPIDVWIKRVMEQMYPDGLPEFVLPWAGIAQQFLFHYIRFGTDLQ